MVITWSEVVVQTWAMKRVRLAIAPAVMKRALSIRKEHKVLPGSPCALQCPSASHVSILQNM